jgi:hypothetical protein
MIARLLYALAVAAAAPAAAHAAEQFDLVCKGRTGASDVGSAAAERRYRIDLAARKWCERDCSQTLPIVEITDEKIVLKHSNSQTPVGDVEQDFYIDRKTKKAYEMQSGPASGAMFSGDCVVEAFSGFTKSHF